MKTSTFEYPPIILPPKADGTSDLLPSDSRHVVIIGANGAGKSRFTEKLITSIPDRAFRMSALKAIYAHSADYHGSIDPIFAEASEKLPMSGRFDTELERLFGLLLQEEMLSIVNYKVRHALSPETPIENTKLDDVIKAWHDIFPDNDILIESGRFLFRRGDDERGYSAVKLSDGERAVLYYLGAILYAPRDGVVFVDSPEIFLHPSVMQTLWNKIESMRPDCLFFYTTHDLEFASSRVGATIVWVRDYNAAHVTWDYDILPPRGGISDDIYLAIIGARKPVLFIEGDDVHSIDAKLYPLVFKEYTVKALGSCDKVIEATRTFNDLNSFHHLDSHGIVDRDRREDKEVEYLRNKKIMVPDVAEIENILMLEEIVRTVASHNGKNENKVFTKVKNSIIEQFRLELKQQALMHTRHRIKRLVEYRIDGKFPNINSLEQHVAELYKELDPRGKYDRLCERFHYFVKTGDYASILKVFNRKSMISASNVAAMCGLRNKDEYIREVISILRADGREADRIRHAVMKCFGIPTENKGDYGEAEK
ncbi:MAG: DUF4435 domain-containing protein [Paramuribaculum sp.]|nr:DUF4435 domain-containing protein [Paramuribaculum sp.]